VVFCGGPNMGGSERRSYQSGSSIQQSRNIAGAMQDVNYFNAIAFGLIEDEPIFEVFDRPTTQVAQRGPLKAAGKAHLGHLGKRAETKDKLPKEAFSDLRVSLFLKIVDMCIDLAPRERSNLKMRHLVFRQCPLRSA